MLLGQQRTTTADIALALSVSHAIVQAVSSGKLARATLVGAVTHDLAVRGVKVCPGT